MFLTKIGKIWYLYYNQSNGKRNKISTKTSSKKEANKFKQDFLLKNQSENQSEKLQIKNCKLSDLRDFAIKYFTEQNPNFYQKGFISNFNKFIDYHSDKIIDQITPLEIENWKIFRVQQVTKTTVNIEFRAFKALFNKAITWGLIKTNPCIGLKQFSVPAKERLTFELNEIEKIIALVELRNPKLKNIILFALYSGCRLNEIINIQWSDIDLNNKTITIRNKSNFLTKSRKFRTIPISDNILTILNQILLKKINVSPDDYVFTKENSKFPYDKSYISRKFKHYLRKAGLPEKFHFHCLRHTFATHFLKATHNIYYAKELLGHSDIKTTTLYLHTDNNSLLNAMNLMQGVQK